MFSKESDYNTCANINACLGFSVVNFITLSLTYIDVGYISQNKLYIILIKVQIRLILFIETKINKIILEKGKTTRPLHISNSRPKRGCIHCNLTSHITDFIKRCNGIT